jgi:regulator of chromosome condensation
VVSFCICGFARFNIFFTSIFFYPLYPTDEVTFFVFLQDSSGTFGLTMSGKPKEEVPVEIVTGHEIIKIGSGDDHLAMLGSNGVVYTVGNGEQGQLGRVTERTAINKDYRHHKQQMLVPASVDLHVARKNSSKIKCSNIWTGSWTTMCQSDKDEKIYVFGLNNYQQIGKTQNFGDVDIL